MCRVTEVIWSRDARISVRSLLRFLDLRAILWQVVFTSKVVSSVSERG